MFYKQCQIHIKKSLAILENYDGDDVDSFSIFQEAVVCESDGESTFRKTDKNGKKENIIMSILKFIPRLCMLIIRKIRTFAQSKDKRKLKKLANEITNSYDGIENITPQDIDSFMTILNTLTTASVFVIDDVNDCINIATTAFEALKYNCEQITEISDKWKKKAQ